MDGQRLRADVRDGARHRRPPRRHVRPSEGVLHRHRDLRVLLPAWRPRSERRAADRDAGRDGDWRRTDVAGDPGDDVRRRPGLAGGLRRRDDPRRGRARERARTADRRRPHRRGELAGDLLPQHPGGRVRGRGHLGEDPPAGRRCRARADRLRGHLHALTRPRDAAVGARPVGRLGLGRFPCPRDDRHRPCRVRRFRRDRATDGRGGAGAQLRDPQPRVHRRLPDDPVPVGGLLQRDPLCAAADGEDPRLQRAQGGGGDAADARRPSGSSPSSPPASPTASACAE